MFELPYSILKIKILEVEDVEGDTVVVLDDVGQHDHLVHQTPTTPTPGLFPKYSRAVQKNGEAYGRGS